MLTRYPRHGATSRVRFEQYFPGLAERGFQLLRAPLWDERYLADYYGGRAVSWAYVAARYAARLAVVLRERAISVVWLEAELFPFLPPWLEEVVAERVPLVVDYDDAVFVKYQLHERRPVRALLGDKIDRVMKSAAVVVAGNAFLADHAAAAGAVDVRVVPTVVDLQRYPSTTPSTEGPLRVGWVGTPHTARYLEALRGPLRALAAEHDLVFVSIGADVDLGVRTERHAWSEGTESALLAGLHVGVMPLPDEPWERGKCGYKLIQTMAAARPVIASPVGANVDIVGDGGVLAGSDDAWLAALRSLASSPARRARLGAAGRQRVAERYELQVTLPQIAGALAAARDR